MIEQTDNGFIVKNAEGGSITVQLIGSDAYIHSLEGPGMITLALELERELKRLEVEIVYATVDIARDDLMNVYMARWGFELKEVVLMKRLYDIDQEIKGAH